MEEKSEYCTATIILTVRYSKQLDKELDIEQRVSLLYSTSFSVFIHARVSFNGNQGVMGNGNTTKRKRRP